MRTIERLFRVNAARPAWPGGAGHWPDISGRRVHDPAGSESKHGRARAQRRETRVAAEQRNLIERAAALQGRTITDSVLTSAQDAAWRTIEERQRLELSVRDSEAFVEALLNSRPVNDRLRNTVRRYRAATLMLNYNVAQVHARGADRRDYEKGLAMFNKLVAESFTVLGVSGVQFRAAAKFADQRMLGLRAGDALHLAIASEHGATVHTLDQRLAEAGRALDVATQVLA